VAGLLTFIITKNLHLGNLALEVGLPTMVSALVFIGAGLLTKQVPEKVEELVLALKEKGE
jgi:hypothetical protein